MSKTLVERILKAHVEVARGEPGAQAKLERLQAAYRTNGSITRVGGECGLVERGSAVPAVKAPLEVPRLAADAAPRLKVKLKRAAREEISRELDALGVARIKRGYETGGSLVGRYVRGEVEVVDASGPEGGPDDTGIERRQIGAVTINALAGLRIASDLARNFADSRLTLLGTWHVHPRDVREPSVADRAGALRSLDLLREEFGWRAPAAWIDLILVVDERRGFDRLTPYGWATRRLNWNGAGVTEPVLVA